MSTGCKFFATLSLWSLARTWSNSTRLDMPRLLRDEHAVHVTVLLQLRSLPHVVRRDGDVPRCLCVAEPKHQFARVYSRTLHKYSGSQELNWATNDSLCSLSLVFVISSPPFFSWFAIGSAYCSSVLHSPYLLSIGHYQRSTLTC